MLGYLIVVRPFKYVINNVLEIFNEGCVLASAFMIFSWTYFPDYEGNGMNDLSPYKVTFDEDNITYTHYIMLGWAFNGIMIANVVVNVVNSIF